MSISVDLARFLRTNTDVRRGGERGRRPVVGARNRGTAALGRLWKFT